MQPPWALPRGDLKLALDVGGRERQENTGAPGGAAAGRPSEQSAHPRACPGRPQDKELSAAAHQTLEAPGLVSGDGSQHSSLLPRREGAAFTPLLVTSGPIPVQVWARPTLFLLAACP